MDNLQIIMIILISTLYGISILADMYHIGTNGNEIKHDRLYYIISFFIDGLIFLGLYLAFWSK